MRSAIYDYMRACARYEDAAPGRHRVEARDALRRAVDALTNQTLACDRPPTRAEIRRAVQEIMR